MELVVVGLGMMSSSLLTLRSNWLIINQVVDFSWAIESVGKVSGMGFNV